MAVAKYLAAVILHKLLLAAAFCLPKGLWDTSSTLLVNPNESGIVTRLLTWDMVYYVSNAQRGQVYEHEYAFSRFWSQIIRYFAWSSSTADLAISACVLSIVSHLTTVILVYVLAKKVFRFQNPVLVATLYSLSPAGIFLVSGYPESAFAALSTAGIIVFYNYNAYIGAGCLFALATLLRSNGLVWGILYATQLLGELPRLRTRSVTRVYTILKLLIGGSIIALAFVYTQVNAYYELCPTLDLPFCQNAIPSIYLYIQKKYWSNGFLAYWTPNNIPNFLFALPTLCLLAQSARYLYSRGWYGLALVHLCMLIGATFFWNVQIITRIGSCLPGIYIYVASLWSTHQAKVGRAWVTYFVVWTLTQAALYGVFMPPA